MIIKEYLENLLKEIKDHPLVKRIYVRNMQVSLRRGYVRAVALLTDDSELHVFEYVNSSLSRLSYSYHYQDPSGDMIFRYDNEPHYPSLPNFPYHKHVAHEEAPRPSEQVNIEEVLREITIYMIRKRE
ncbi:MAG: DUF6516 family protein [Candidatus Bathyarchaeia archaeon]